MKNVKIKTIFQSLGLVVFVYILFQIDYNIFFKEALLLKWHFLIIAAIIMIAEIVVKSLRWRCVLSALGIFISTSSALSLQWLGFFLGVVTPGRIGELIKVYFLKDQGHSVFRSFFSVILDRIIDIFILLLLATLIFFFFLPEIGVYLVIFGAMLLIPIIFIFLLIDQRSYLHRVFGKLIKKLIPFDFNDYNRFDFNKFWQGIRNLKRGDTISFFVYLVAGWFFYFAARYFIALSMGLELSFVDVATISVLVAIVSILPISIAGLGTREITVIYLFGLFNINKETALLFSLLIFTIDLIITSLGLIPYLKESLLINRVKKYEFK